MKQFCLVCYRWDTSNGDGTRHYSEQHQDFVRQYKDSGGSALLQRICYNLPPLLSHGQLVPILLYQYIMKFGASPQCRSPDQRQNDKELTQCEQVDECLRSDHPGVYRKKVDTNGVFNSHQCTLCKKWNAPYGKDSTCFQATMRNGQK